MDSAGKCNFWILEGIQVFLGIHKGESGCNHCIFAAFQQEIKIIIFLAST